MIVSPVTVNGAVALTRSPACRFDRAPASCEAFATSISRLAVNAGRLCVYEIAWS
jgi:hypothetical protein